MKMHPWQSKQIPILQLGNDFYDPSQAAVFPEKKLRYWNSSLDIKGISQDHFVNFNPITNNLQNPLALRYHGHQFKHYNPELGDGRGFLFGQIEINNQWYDFGTKGSGQTLYSRSGDGRLTLKGAYRESLATEMLESLGVKTSRTLCFFETGEDLDRNDEPSPTRSAVLTRFSLGHIRIGTFQRLAYFKQVENIKKLTYYCMNFYYTAENSKIDPTDENLLGSRFLQCVVEANAKLVAQVMMAGFVHGVLNTDNINISGELFDYGPYRFMPNYDPEFTAAYFDREGLYCFGRQPASFLWGLHQLAGSLKLAYPELPTEEILGQFSELFNTHVQTEFFKRLNLVPQGAEQNSEFLSNFFSYMEKNKINFEDMFFDFHSKKSLSSDKYESLLLKQLSTFNVADEKLAQHPYITGEKPCTLLINEIESIWKPISEKDDWSSYEQKLQSIRKMRGVY
ncbi:MAG: protein adenylyltransferase SelO family protein [Pseudobdellovibrio sp.]